MWILIIALLSAADSSACVCVCVDGLAKTQCVTARAARASPAACGRNRMCPVVPPASFGDSALPEDTGLPQSLGAEELPPLETPLYMPCPEIRVWREAWQSFDGVRVCDAA